MLDYFETKLHKPGVPVRQGNLAVYYLLYVALTSKQVWHPWALDGGIRHHKTCPAALCMAISMCGM